MLIIVTVESSVSNLFKIMHFCIRIKKKCLTFCNSGSLYTLLTCLSMCIYLCLCHRGRQIGSSRSGPTVTAKPLWWTAGAAGWIGPLLRWGSWVSLGWCAGPHRTTSTCSPSACHKGRRWRRPPLNTENRLMWGWERKEEGWRAWLGIEGSRSKKEKSWINGGKNRKHNFRLYTVFFYILHWFCKWANKTVEWKKTHGP